MSGTSDKKTGGTRNYAKQPGTLNKRREAFDKLMASGEYDPDLSYFDSSGGYVAVHKEHNIYDSEMRASRDLAKHGYKVKLNSEKSIKLNDGKRDGDLYETPIDFKEIGTAGNNTIKTKLEKATKQGAKSVVVVQGNKSVTRNYIDSQIKLFKDKSPRLAVSKLQSVFVVGLDGSVHRHVLQ